MNVKEAWATVRAYYEVYEYTKRKAILFIEFAFLTLPFLLFSQFVFGNSLVYWHFVILTSTFTLIAFGLGFILRKMERQMKRIKEGRNA